MVEDFVSLGRAILDNEFGPLGELKDVDRFHLVSDDRVGFAFGILNGRIGGTEVTEVTRVNVAASRSRIEDTDFAQSTAEQQQNQAIIEANISVQRDEQDRRGLLIDEIV